MFEGSFRVLRGDVIAHGAELAAMAERWDALAAGAGNPYAAPSWSLAALRHAVPAGTELRALIARDGDEIVAIAPFVTERGPGGTLRLRMAGSYGADRAEPVAVPGREREAAAVFAQLLSELRPRADIIAFHGIPDPSPWPAALVECWPGRPPWRHVDLTMDAPRLPLSGTFEEWWQSRSHNFRQDLGRRRRRLDDQGARFRLASDPADIASGLTAFADLHRARWAERGGSSVLSEGVERMLHDVARDLPAGERFRLWLIEADGRIVSSQLFLACGGVVRYWLGGFDDAWGKYSPAVLAILAEIEHAWSRGDRSVDLGAGAQEYKRRFTDQTERLVWHTIVPRGSRYPLARLALSPGYVRRNVSERLSEETKRRLKRLLGAFSRRGPRRADPGGA